MGACHLGSLTKLQFFLDWANFVLLGQNFTILWNIYPITSTNDGFEKKNPNFAKFQIKKIIKFLPYVIVGTNNVEGFWKTITMKSIL
jgi:hypothetical protein